MTDIQRIPYTYHERLIAGTKIPDSQRKSTHCYGKYSFAPAKGQYAGSKGFLTFWRQPTGEFYAGGICVEPEYQGTGVAATLLHKLIAIAKEAGAPAVLADVCKDNTRSRMFFEKHGFKEFFDQEFHSPLCVDYKLALPQEARVTLHERRSQRELEKILTAGAQQSR